MESFHLYERPQRASINRNLHDGPDYRPDWRFLTVEQYLLKIGKADDRSAQLGETLLRETDAGAGGRRFSYKTARTFWPSFYIYVCT